MFKNKCDKLYRIVSIGILNWHIEGIPIISFDSYFKAREYRAIRGENMELNEKDITRIKFLIIDRIATLQFEVDKAKESLEYKSVMQKEKEIKELELLLKKIRF